MERLARSPPRSLTQTARSACCLSARSITSPKTCRFRSTSRAPRASLDAGQLSLYVAQRTGRLGLLRLAWRALFGRLRGAQDFDALCSREIFIETSRRRLRVATDGEVTIMQTPLHYRVRPGALR